jgi:ribosomal protein L10
MSKFVKGLIAKELSSKLDGVDDALFVNVIGLDANQSVALRRELREKSIDLMVVKKSLACRAREGSPLAKAMGEMEGSLALVWGSEDFVSLAKEITRLNNDTQLAAFETRGGVMDGEHLTPERVKEISKWPSREEQLSLLVGQILGPGGQLAAALVGPGGQLASQIKQKSEGDEE